MSEWLKVSETGETLSVCISGSTVKEVSKEDLLTAAMIVDNSLKVSKAQQIANLIMHQRNLERHAEAIKTLVDVSDLI